MRRNRTYDDCHADERFIAIGSKAATLEHVAPQLTTAQVPESRRFTVGHWFGHRRRVIRAVAPLLKNNSSLVVRSSTLYEDLHSTLSPGKYETVHSVIDEDSLEKAIDQVITSYRNDVSSADLVRQEVLVQSAITDARCSGVVMTYDPNSGGPYYVVNYETDGDTTAVTAATSEASLKTAYVARNANFARLDTELNQLIALAQELEQLTGSYSLDIEFAVDRERCLYLLQVRSLCASSPGLADPMSLAAIKDKVTSLRRCHPQLLGNRTVFGTMPDWNPAEIIGHKPRSLSLSLYQHLITDTQWADQRARYGYRDVRGVPLLVELGGSPYIDVRASANSLIPASVDNSVASKLVHHYVDRLRQAPELHDKYEFEVALSCFTFVTGDRVRQETSGFLSSGEQKHLMDALHELTCGLLDPTHPAVVEDASALETLKRRYDTVCASTADNTTKLYCHLQDCRRYGSLPFAGFARLGFIAVELLRSLVRRGVFTESDLAQFMASLDTSTSRLLEDRRNLSKNQFIRQYGFLRPGTYDIRSPRYSEAFDEYFGTHVNNERAHNPKSFQTTSDQLHVIDSLLQEHSLPIDAPGLLTFIRRSIEAREEAKSAFTRTLSEVLHLTSVIGQTHGLTVEELSHLTVADLERLYFSSEDTETAMRRAIRNNRDSHELNCALVLPPVITTADEIEAFHVPSSRPNYITQESFSGPLLSSAFATPRRLTGIVLLLPNGDPGYDWVFDTGIVGLITQYGGANSHMAIRSHQLGVPCVLGVGEQLFQRLERASYVSVDCETKTLDIVA